MDDGASCRCQGMGRHMIGMPIVYTVNLLARGRFQSTADRVDCYQISLKRLFELKLHSSRKTENMPFLFNRGHGSLALNSVEKWRFVLFIPGTWDRAKVNVFFANNIVHFLGCYYTFSARRHGFMSQNREDAKIYEFASMEIKIQLLSSCS